MANKKASEDNLSELHGVLAKVFTTVVQQQEDEVVYDEEGAPSPTGNKIYTATPATLSAAVKFLKDNQITCDITQDENMGQLRDVLSKKQKHSRLANASADVALSLVQDN